MTAGDAARMLGLITALTGVFACGGEGPIEGRPTCTGVGELTFLRCQDEDGRFVDPPDGYALAFCGGARWADLRCMRGGSGEIDCTATCGGYDRVEPACGPRGEVVCADGSTARCEWVPIVTAAECQQAEEDCAPTTLPDEPGFTATLRCEL